jgi:hypothetical protein
MGSEIMVGTHKEVAPSNANPLMGGQAAPIDKAQNPKTTTARLQELKKLKIFAVNANNAYTHQSNCATLRS